MDWSVLDSLYYALVTSTIITVSSFILFVSLYFYIRSKALSVKSAQPESEISVGFFHPYCNAGGGGERVLWQAVKVTQTR